jgi:hypothetical protein
LIPQLIQYLADTAPSVAGKSSGALSTFAVNAAESYLTGQNDQPINLAADYSAWSANQRSK